MRGLRLRQAISAGLFLVSLGALGLGGLKTAWADEPTSWSCGLVEENTIHIDGLTSDWDGVSPTILKVDPVPGSPPRTLGVKLRCNYDEKSVYLLIDVDDDIVLRSAAAASGEDHIELHFGVPDKKGGNVHVDKLFIYPGSYQLKQKRVVRWQAKHPPKVIEGEGPAGRKKGAKVPLAFEVYDALQPRGYAVELRMPKKLIPGYQDGAPLRLNLRVVDSDAPNAQLTASAELSPSEPADALAVLEFEQGQTSLDDMLSELKLSSGDVFFDKTADIGDGPGRVLMAGKFLAFTGKNYAYQEMAPQRADIKSVQLINLDAKHQAMALRLSERGGGGGREVLRVFVLSGGRFQSIFAAEVSKEQGARRLSTQVSFEQRGSGTEIVLLPQPAVGFSAATYNELPAEDVIPILLPWTDKRTRYVYKGGSYSKQ
jgi:hypothetical protein